jgi:hypothetical protein
MLVISMLWVFSQGSWPVHSMTALLTIKSCLEQRLQVMAMPGFRAETLSLLVRPIKHYRVKRRTFQ